MDTNAHPILVITRSLRGGGLPLVVAVVLLALAAFVVASLALGAIDPSPEPVLLAPLRWETCRGAACVA